MDRDRFDYLSYSQIHGLRKRRGYNRTDSEEVLNTRLDSMAGEENKRKLTGDGAMDTSATVTGERGRPPAYVAEVSSGPTYTQDKRYRVDARRLACVAEKEVLRGHTNRRNPELKSRVGAAGPSVAIHAGIAATHSNSICCNPRDFVAGQ